MADWSFLKRGDQLHLDGKQWRVEHIVLNGPTSTDVARVVLLDIVDGRSCNLTGYELSEFYDTGRLTLWGAFAHKEDVRPFADDELPLDVRVRLLYTRAFDEERPTKSTAALQAFIDCLYCKADFPHRKPSPGSLRRWVNERGAPGQRLPCFMRRRHTTGPRGMRAAPELAAIIEQNLDRYFWGR